MKVASYQLRTLVLPSTATLPAINVSKLLVQSNASPSASASLLSQSTFPKTFLPRTALQRSAHHVDNLQQLLHFRACFKKKEFWSECLILERMHYKNKSQHRLAGYFQRLCECRRLSSRMKELDIAGLMDELAKKFFSEKSLRTITSVNNQWDSIPYRSAVAFTMTRIIGAILLLKKLQCALHETYGAFYQLMSKTQFMPFALVAIGMCSRLSLISSAWTNELLDCYRLLETWIKTFPKEEGLPMEVDYESRLPESVDSLLLSTVVPDIPNPVSQPMLQQPPMEAGDLGEVIARIETPLETEPDSPNYSPSSPNTVHQQPQQAQPKRLSDTMTNSLSNQPKKQKANPVRDDVAAGNNKSMVDPMMTSPSGSETPTCLPTTGLETGSKKKIKTKPKTGSATNFDNIFGSEHMAFNVGSEPLQARQKKAKGSESRLGNEKDIDSIFGAVKKSKKSATSEIDNIFGPSKKKKKKIQ
ncbi:hypothetical protein BGZ75_000838 [Mortierella antarctica]|nr:hypothetical protein BGZ75_000838 [Mortierella antarctica]